MAVFENWQRANASVKERSFFLFNNDLISDVRLVVGATSHENEAKKRKMAISAHRFVLSVRSPVFFAMFCGKMADKSDSIDLPDCEYEGVLEMLRYMYSEEVKLNESNVVQVLYVAKKYMLPTLADKCIEFLHRHVDPANVFCVLSHAQQYDEKSLVNRCWEVIDRRTEEAVKSEAFATIERSLLEATVKRDSLNISELELFEAVDLWATKECERQGLAVDSKLKRRILGDQIVKVIRFPAMEKEEFASLLADCNNFLTRAERRGLMKKFSGELTTPVGFPEEKRVGSFRSCCRFGRLYSVTHDENLGWCYDPAEDGWPCLDAIKFWVDKDVTLHGIQSFGSKNIKFGVALKIIDWENKEIVLNKKKEIFSSVPLPCKEEEIDGFDIMFDPLVLKKNNVYVIKAKMYGQEPCFGGNGVDTVKCHGVTFHFKDYESRSRENTTDVSCGQFAEFFFKPI